MKSTKKQIETLFTMAKERGLVPMWTHYWRLDDVGGKKLGGTSCVLLDGDYNMISRGMALVSRKDNGDKAYGRLLSLKRAYNAAVTIKEKRIDHENEELRVTDLLDFGRITTPKIVKRPLPCDISTVEDERIAAKKDRRAVQKA